METKVIDLNKLIMDAMKAHDTVRTETLRAIKTAFMNWQTSKEHAGKELTYADSMQIIKKMVKQREESIDQYVTAGRQELADAEQAQINVLKEFLPAEITAVPKATTLIGVRDGCGTYKTTSCGKLIVPVAVPATLLASVYVTVTGILIVA